MRESSFAHEVDVYRESTVVVDRQKQKTREILFPGQRCLLQLASNVVARTLLGTTEDQSWTAWFPADADVIQGDELEWLMNDETFIVQAVSPGYDREGVLIHKQATLARRQL